MLPRAVAIVAVLAAAAGCAGDDDASATTASVTTMAVSETSAPVTAAPTQAAETMPPTVEPTRSTVSPEPTPSTTKTLTPPVDSVATSASPGGVSDRVAVIEANEAAWMASVDVLRDPFDDDKLERLAGHYTGDQLEGLRNVVASYRAKNYREVENTAEPDSLDIDLASVAVNETGDFATVQACEVTSGIVVEIGANADGRDLVIDDRIGRVAIEVDTVLEGRVWKVASVRALDPSDALASCE